MRETEWDCASDSDLLEAYDRELQLRRAVQERIGRIEQEIYHRLEARHALAIPSDAFTCELVQNWGYDQSRFVALKELLTEVDLAECWAPEHEETVRVPERWNTVKVKALARRYGEKALTIVEDARIPEKPRLKFGLRNARAAATSLP